MQQRDNLRKIGSSEEDRAAAFLERKGCTIIERNFRCSAGEIDIIFSDDGIICFGEVKFRESLANGLPEEAVDKRKQRKICRTSDHYRMKNSLDESFRYRFDVLSLTPDSVKWLKNAFGYIRR